MSPMAIGRATILIGSEKRDARSFGNPLTAYVPSPTRTRETNVMANKSNLNPITHRADGGERIRKNITEV